MRDLIYSYSIENGVSGATLKRAEVNSVADLIENVFADSFAAMDCLGDSLDRGIEIPNDTQSGFWKSPGGNDGRNREPRLRIR
jgi:hypothetical protein